MKKLIILLMTILYLNPIVISAYSKYIYAGGESIGIELKSDYILVVGKYEDVSLKIGDKIISVDDKKVTNIKELTENMNKQ